MKRFIRPTLLALGVVANAAIAALAIGSAVPAFSQNRTVEPNDSSTAPQYEIIDRPAENAPENAPRDLQAAPGSGDDREAPIDDPWTWFCLVNFPPEELADCINGIP